MHKSGPIQTTQDGAAFRFWFDHPAKNLGYAVEVTGNEGEHTTFWGSDQEDGRFGSVLSVTFTVPAEEDKAPAGTRLGG